MKVTFEAKDFAALNYTYAHYYGLKIPKKLVREAILEHGDALKEIAAGCYIDTAAREYFIDAITYHIGIDSWPCNGDGEKTRNKFCKQLKEAMEEHSIKFVTDEEKKTINKTYRKYFS